METKNRNSCANCVFAVLDDKPHCGLRGFTDKFNIKNCSAENNILPNGYELQEDGYFSWVQNKSVYPNTYEECCFHTPVNEQPRIARSLPIKWAILLEYFSKLLICRDAYWKIAGEQMGLDKPWDSVYGCGEWGYWIGYDINANKIYCQDSRLLLNRLLVFPTKEMRDAFYENFKDLIEQCKELL